MNISKGRSYLIKEKCGGLGVAFLSHARLELNSLTLLVLKANRDRTARPLTESESKGNFFLPETRGKKEGHGHRCGVAFKHSQNKPPDSAYGFQKLAAKAAGIF